MIGLPNEEEWPNDVTLSRENFSPQNPQPITDQIPELTNEGADLLMVCVCVFVCVAALKQTHTRSISNHMHSL